MAAMRLPCFDGRRDASLLLLEIDEVFGVEEAGGNIGAVVGAAGLADDLSVTSGNAAMARRARLVKSMLAVGPSLGAREPRTQMAPSSRWGRNSEPMTPPKLRYMAMAKMTSETPTVILRLHDGPAHAGAIVRTRKPMSGFSHSLAPLLKSRLARRARRRWRSQRAEQREGDGPGHGLEEAAFNGLQREDGQVGGDDDGDGEEDGALHFLRGVANLLLRRVRCRSCERDGG
jgi:hypothetical protein